MNYSYAITGHKSQGGEWDNVFIDLTTVAKNRETLTYDILKYSNHPKGWKYTATTRASKKAYWKRRLSCRVPPCRDIYDNEGNDIFTR